MTPAELMDNRQRAQSIAFLRTLRAGDEGQTIYQGVIDDVLAELDAARAEADDLRRGQVATLLRQVDELRADSARGESRALASQDEEISRLRHELRGARAVKDAKATPARLDPTGTAEPRTSLVGHARAGDRIGPGSVMADTHVDRATGTRTPLGVDRVAVFDAWAAELRERRPSPEPNDSPLATGRPHTNWHGSPCSCSWGADHGNGSPEQSEFAQRGPAPWVLACVRALEAAPGSAHVFRAALSLVPADVLAAARDGTKGVE